MDFEKRRNICQEETRFDKGLARARTQRLHLVSGSLVFLVKGVENPFEQRISFYIQPRRRKKKKKERYRSKNWKEERDIGESSCVAA